MDYCYKKLNKTLIEEVQAMRIQIASYQRELNEINKQMMNEHGLRVDQEQRFLQILTQNFRDMVLQVRPDANCLNLLQNDNDCCSDNADCTMNKRLSSNNIRNNLRRSMQLQSARQSVVTKSPISRRNSIEDDGLPKTNQNEASVNDLEKSYIANELQAAQMEESVNDLEKSYIADELQAAKMEESVSDLEQSSIVDVDADEEYDEQQQNFVEEEQEEADCSQNDDEESEDEEAHDTEASEITAAVRKLSLLEKINEEDYENIEPVSTAFNEKNSLHLNKIKQPKRSGKSLLRDLTNCDDFLMRASPPDLSIEDSFNLPLLTVRNRLICSTPRNTQEFKDEYSVSKNNKSSDCADESSIAQTRPRRSCKPINLSEKSCRVKLRNETVIKCKKKSISSGKRKTKTMCKQEEDS